MIIIVFIFTAVKFGIFLTQKKEKNPNFFKSATAYSKDFFLDYKVVYRGLVSNLTKMDSTL